jgi:hypothetical protein
MKTFSSMSVPDKILTRTSYLRNLAFINQCLQSDNTLTLEKTAKLQTEAARLQVLLDVLDAELLSE